MKVLDIFAGAGGFSLGFKNGGCEIIGAIEVDTWAAETFAFNHPDTRVIKSNVEEIDDDTILKTFRTSKPDIILGSPPCQGFSICSKHNGDPKDPRNSLFEEFVRFGKILNPKIMIMENVPNLIKARTSEKKLLIDIIKSELSKYGYFVYHSILEAVNYGVPQIRKRLFVIASKKELHHPFPKPTHSPTLDDLFSFILKKTPTLWEAISDLPNIEAREGAEVMDYTSEPLNEFQKKIRNKSDKVYNHLAMKHAKRTVERFKSMEWGQSSADVLEHLKPYKRNSNGILSEKVYDQNNRRMHPDKPCHTIPASFYANFVHPYRHRNFTAREGARIQTFPDTYMFKGKPTVVSHKLLEREGRFDEKYLCQYNQIGNAVPPLLAEAIARNLLKQIQ
ncbi:DNA cytosine methyltransferase [Spirulina sp. 06S082]|uniref:DNA cytosine methyltransferase n=1 Tax=Spirulina sp. 06S082 TaxID=3110248 RepID=UPI002B21CC59|nr:DNA cytosine methyltransferase [Spirulina sp. 06S082]MEA5467394.1 DNA cytosine methyltransferase [Spirulina sp. 06S082]